MLFKSTLIEYQPVTKDIENKLKEMKKLMDSDQIPPPTEECEDCLYLDTGKNLINNE